MKFFVVIPDGVSERFQENTALNLAKTHYLDEIAPRSLIGLARTIPFGLPPGSDVGTLSIFGFDPCIYARGRSPLEIAAKKVIPPEDTVVFRMNLVSIQDGIMKDHSAGHIKDQEAQKIIENMKEQFYDFFKKNNMEIYFGKSYRNYLIWRIGDKKREKQILETEFTPPHDILEKEIKPHLEIYQNVAPELLWLIKSSWEFLRGTSADSVWFWGQGKRAQLPQFEKTYNKKGWLVSAVDIVKGVAVLSGVEVIDIPGITGYLDSNFEGKADAILQNVKENEVGFVHIEATDETGHQGDREKKTLAVQIVDSRVIGRIIDNVKEKFRLLVIPDHQTPCEVRTHVGDLVPFLIYPCPLCEGKGCYGCGKKRFTELQAASSGLVFDGRIIMSYFLKT